MDKFKELLSKCKCTVDLTVNQHRNYYESVESYFNENEQEEIDVHIMDGMKRLDTIVKLQFYPDTPIGFYIIYHYDIDEAIEYALQILITNGTTIPT